jgi:kynurenine formamidase
MTLPLDRLGPMHGTGARVNPQHLMIRMPHDDIPGVTDGGLQRASDDAVYLPLQCSTQWDGFPHFFYDGVTYNGRPIDSVTTLAGATVNSITKLAPHAMGRGVLLDIPRFLGRDWLEPGDAIQDEDLERCAAQQGVDVGRGDVVLVRTGHLRKHRDAGAWGDFAGGEAPGLGVSAADFLCSRQVAAVATDTWGFEAIPYETSDLMSPLHVILLVNAGVYIGEMWDMEALAEDCSDDGVYEFLLSAPPLMVTGAVGSPLTPLAVK